MAVFTKYVLKFCLSALVICFWAEFTHGYGTGVRLADGLVPGEGRLEVMYRGEWGTVCGWTFGSEEALVACRSLGYRTGYKFPLGAPESPSKELGPVLLDGLRCIGDEWALEMCYHYGWGQVKRDCQTHKWDVWLSCEEPDEVDLDEDLLDQEAGAGGTGGEEPEVDMLGDEGKVLEDRDQQGKDCNEI